VCHHPDIESAASWLFDTRFNHIETVVVGCLIMFTENVCISKGDVNGVTATIHETECSDDGMVTSFTIQLTDTEIKMKL
jgi:hypothetical protein